MADIKKHLSITVIGLFDRPSPTNFQRFFSKVEIPLQHYFYQRFQIRQVKMKLKHEEFGYLYFRLMKFLRVLV